MLCRANPSWALLLFAFTGDHELKGKKKKECLVWINFLVTVYHFPGMIFLLGYGLIQSYYKATKVGVVDFMSKEKLV